MPMSTTYTGKLDQQPTASHDSTSKEEDATEQQQEHENGPTDK